MNRLRYAARVMLLTVGLVSAMLLNSCEGGSADPLLGRHVELLSDAFLVRFPRAGFYTLVRPGSDQYVPVTVGSYERLGTEWRNDPEHVRHFRGSRPLEGVKLVGLIRRSSVLTITSVEKERDGSEPYVRVMASVETPELGLIEVSINRMLFGIYGRNPSPELDTHYLKFVDEP